MIDFLSIVALLAVLWWVGVFRLLGEVVKAIREKGDE